MEKLLKILVLAALAFGLWSYLNSQKDKSLVNVEVKQNEDKKWKDATQERLNNSIKEETGKAQNRKTE